MSLMGAFHRFLPEADIRLKSPNACWLPEADPRPTIGSGIPPGDMLCPRRRGVGGSMLGRRVFMTLAGVAALAWPVAARAQQPERMRRIGLLSGITESDSQVQGWFKTFVKRLEELGWFNGSNIQIDTRFGHADATRLSVSASELVELGPDVIFASGAPAAIAARERTLSIPIVFVNVADPVSTGFVTNLARPEGNITGFTNFEFSIGGKWLQLLKECAPNTDRIALVFDPANQIWTGYLRTIEAAAPSFGIRLIPVGVRDAAEIAQRIAAFAHDHPHGAVVVLPSSFTILHRRLIVDAVAMQRLPTMYSERLFCVDGGLMSYGVRAPDLYNDAASYVDRLLRGAKVAELPVQLPTKFELVVNLKTAKTLGLAVPATLLAAADIIE
jgi:putative tryptophan/tyrosine transport system substrate-binding protein